MRERWESECEGDVHFHSTKIGSPDSNARCLAVRPVRQTGLTSQVCSVPWTHGGHEHPGEAQCELGSVDKAADQ